jgi:hypothetical protein
VVKIATFAKPENVSGQAKDGTETITNGIFKSTFQIKQKTK